MPYKEKTAHARRRAVVSSTGTIKLTGEEVSRTKEFDSQTYLRRLAVNGSGRSTGGLLSTGPLKRGGGYGR